MKPNSIIINGTRNTKNANGRNCPGFKWKIFAAKTVGMLQGTSVMPTVPAASVQRDKFLVASLISLYFCTNVRAGKIFDKYCSPLARATINVDKIGRASCRERVEMTVVGERSGGESR